MLSRSTRGATRLSRHCFQHSLSHSSPAGSSSSSALRHARCLSTSHLAFKPQTAWAEATESAHSILTPPPSSMSKAEYDPLSAVYEEIGNLRSGLFNLLGSSHPGLDTVAKYYFQAEGKHIRPLIVLLMSQATNGLGGRGWEASRIDAAARSVDDSLTSRGGVLNDWNPEQHGPEPQKVIKFTDPFQIPNTPPPPPTPVLTHLDSLPPSDPNTPEILSTQRRLASIIEMIHVASLLHDDVVDTSELRRGAPSAPSAFGNKLSILAGDFLLGRASVSLARLGSSEVVELMSTIIANLVEGEVLQLAATSEPETTPTPQGFEKYMRKTYLKTASLMAKSARGAVVLGGCGAEVEGSREGEWVKDVAYGYGRNLGIAFQLIDDALDYLPTPASLGKPGFGADLSLGLATAPALFAWETNPQLGPLILRKFEGEGDVETARDIVGKSDGVQRTIALARDFAGAARSLIEQLPPSAARDALVGLTVKVVERVK